MSRYRLCYARNLGHLSSRQPVSNPWLSPYSLAHCKKCLNDLNQHLQRWRNSKISCRGRCLPRVCASAHNSKSLKLIIEVPLSCILPSIKKRAPSRFLQNPKEKTANDLSMLLANLSKSPSLERLLDLKRAKLAALSSSSSALGQLIDLFNLGSKYNSSATFDYLAYVFADLAKVNTPPPFFYGLYPSPSSGAPAAQPRSNSEISGWAA